MTKIDICPFCGSPDVYSDTDGLHYCNECESTFNDEDYEFETIRHKVSALLVDTSEDKPLDISDRNVLLGEDEAQGLSTLEMPTIVSLFHDHDAIIWINIYGYPEPVEFDTLSLDDARNLLSSMSE